jgi:hypothetical protein
MYCTENDVYTLRQYNAVREEFDGISADTVLNAKKNGGDLNGTAYGGKPDPLVSDGISGNFIMTQFTNRDMPVLALNDGSFATLLAEKDTQAFTDFMDILEKFCDTLVNSDAIKKALDYFKNMFTDPSNLFTNMFCGFLEMIKGIATAAMAGLNMVVQSLLALAKTLIQTIRTILTTPLNIPFVSSLLLAKGLIPRPLGRNLGY